jgi:hypothetical protein
MLTRNLPHSTRTMTSMLSLGRPHISQVSQYVDSEVPDNVINLGIGQPGPELLKKTKALVTKSMEGLLAADFDPFLLQYGAGPGYADFRRVMAPIHPTRASLPAQHNRITTTPHPPPGSWAFPDRRVPVTHRGRPPLHNWW